MANLLYLALIMHSLVYFSEIYFEGGLSQDSCISASEGVGEETGGVGACSGPVAALWRVRRSPSSSPWHMAHHLATEAPCTLAIFGARITQEWNRANPAIMSRNHGNPSP